MQKRIFSRREAAWTSKLQKVSITKEPLTTNVVTDGVILPVRRQIQRSVSSTYMLEGLFEGGVATKHYTFVAGSIRNSSRPKSNYSCCAAYKPKGVVEARDERVVFGGVLYGHYGHMLLDGLSRMWWFAQNPDTPLKFVFVMMPGESPRMAQELLRLMGLRDDQYEIVDRPVSFSQVIVPDEGVHSLEGKAHAQWLALFDLIRNHCVDSSIEGSRERIYLTRTKLAKNDGVGEEYYEKLFGAHGYEVIAPEKLALKDQIKLYADAKHIACTMGTLSHAALFAQPGTELTCLLRCGATNMPQLIVNEARELDWSMFDAFRNVLPTEQGYGAYLYAPTQYLRDYAKARGWELPQGVDDDIIDALAAPYLRLWLRTYSDQHNFKAIENKSLFDVLNSLSISFDGTELRRDAYRSGASLLAKVRRKLAKGILWTPKR